MPTKLHYMPSTALVAARASVAVAPVAADPGRYIRYVPGEMGPATLPTSTHPAHRRRIRSRGFVMKLKSLGAQILIAGALGASTIIFGAGAAHAAHVAPRPAPGPRPGVVSLPWGVFGPYIPSPPPIDSSGEGQGGSAGGTWPPTNVSWPPGGGGSSATSHIPIVMPVGPSAPAGPSERPKPIVPARTHGAGAVSSTRRAANWGRLGRQHGSSRITKPTRAAPPRRLAAGKPVKQMWPVGQTLCPVCPVNERYAQWTNPGVIALGSRLQAPSTAVEVIDGRARSDGNSV